MKILPDTVMNFMFAAVTMDRALLCLLIDEGSGDPSERATRSSQSSREARVFHQCQDQMWLTRNEDPTSVHPLDFKQISLLAEGTQSPSPLAAEEATSHASKTRLDGKTQSLLP
jgi:hypothetical protein